MNEPEKHRVKFPACAPYFRCRRKYRKNEVIMKKLLLSVLIITMLVSLTSCGGTNKNDTIVIYDGQYSEMQIIHHMVKILVEKNTDLKVEIKDEMAPVNLFNELIKGSSDVMNSYDGTLLTTYLHLDPSDVPSDTTLYDYVNEEGRKQKNVTLLDKLGINNTYTIAVPMDIAEQYNLSTVSDLVTVADQLVFGAEHDFFTEEGSAKFNPFVEFYGLNFKEAKQLDINLKYSAVESGNIDVTVVYATDGLNKKSQLIILTDDLNFFPEYNGALLVKADFFEKYKATAPDLEEVLASMSGIFTDEDMINLSYMVDVDGRSVAEVSEEYLQQKGLLD